MSRVFVPAVMTLSRAGPLPQIDRIPNVGASLLAITKGTDLFNPMDVFGQQIRLRF